MVRENATQIGQNAAATIDSVAAAMRRIAYLTLTGEWETSEQLFRGLYGDERGFETARGQIASGRGVGRAAIKKFLPNDSLTLDEIQTALGVIKSGDLHVRIIDEVTEKIRAERPEAEKRLKEYEAEQNRIETEQKKAEEKAAKEAATRQYALSATSKVKTSLARRSCCVASRTTTSVKPSNRQILRKNRASRL